MVCMSLTAAWAVPGLRAHGVSLYPCWAARAAILFPLQKPEPTVSAAKRLHSVVEVTWPLGLALWFLRILGKSFNLSLSLGFPMAGECVRPYFLKTER